MPIFGLCITNGERKEIVSPSFSECILKNLGTNVFFVIFFVEVDELDLVG